MTDRPTVRDYMARDLITLSPQTEINAAMHVLLDKAISGAPVVDDKGALVGVLSKKDCLKAALHASYFRAWGGLVSDYMNSKPETLPADMDIVEAAEVFLAGSYRRFPVVDGGGLVGQVSRADILKALSELWT